MPEDIIKRNIARIKPFNVFVVNNSGFEDILSNESSLYSLAVGLAVRSL